MTINNPKIKLVKWKCKPLAGACKRAGLSHWGHHAMRHFFCSTAIEAGIDFKVIAEYLGHKDSGILVAKTYGHLRAEHSTASRRDEAVIYGHPITSAATKEIKVTEL
jgi:integrase